MAKLTYSAIIIYGILGLALTAAFGATDSDLLNRKFTEHNIVYTLCLHDDNPNSILHLVCAGRMRLDQARYELMFNPHVYDALRRQGIFK